MTSLTPATRILSTQAALKFFFAKSWSASASGYATTSTFMPPAFATCRMTVTAASVARPSTGPVPASTK